MGKVLDINLDRKIVVLHYFSMMCLVFSRQYTCPPTEALMTIFGVRGGMFQK